MNSSPLGARSWERHKCGTEGLFLVGTGEVRARMLDASRGGFKLRFEHSDAVTAVLSPLPRDVKVSTDGYSNFLATVMWAKDGLAGCRFYQHLSLDDVVQLMTRQFKLNLT
ncbi:conserved hypothetical protein [Candidatus Terasakiella magnetica]|nr:conserved hypothetical protein [Candidatus Terasakiella magnetica]